MASFAWDDISETDLFAGGPVVELLAERVNDLREQVRSAGDEALFASDGALAQQLVEAGQFEPLAVDRDQARRTPPEEGEFLWQGDEVVPETVRGVTVDFYLPFTGEKQLLKRFADEGLPRPRGGTVGGELFRRFQFPLLATGIESEVAAWLDALQENLNAQQELLATFHEQLPDVVEQLIAERRKELISLRESLDNTGIPEVQRSDIAPAFYEAPVIVKAPTPVGPSSSTAEPVLVGGFYEHIIEVISAMTTAMERAPGDYAEWDQEPLRDTLVVILNTHYRGAVSGEAFRRKGKTDLLVTVEDKAVFVGECKVWGGESKFAKPDAPDPSALDQLFLYLTWRDTKLALVMFVHEKKLTTVIKRAHAKIASRTDAFLGWTDPYASVDHCEQEGSCAAA